MDLRQLEYFVRVAELGSFTRASVVLDIAQPALSRQVRLLETELHQNLLLRNGRGVTVTEAGKVLLEHSRGVLHQIERIREELGRLRGVPSGRVALGLPPSLSKVLTVPITREMRTHLPEASLSISEGLSVTMRELLMTGRLDIALLYNARPSSDIDLEPLFDEALFFIQRRDGGPDGPISLRELAQHGLVIPGRPNAIRMLVETELAALGCRPKIAFETDGIAAILDLVADGMGSAVLSWNAAATATEPDRFVARPIVRPDLLCKVSLAVSARRPTTATQLAVLERVREIAPRLVRHVPYQP